MHSCDALSRAAVLQPPGTIKPSPPPQISQEDICLHCKFPQSTNRASSVHLQLRELCRVSHGHAFLKEPLRRGSVAGALAGSCVSQRIPRLCLPNVRGFSFPLTSLGSSAACGQRGAEAGAGARLRAGRVHVSSPHHCNYSGIYCPLVFSGKRHVKDLGARREREVGAKLPSAAVSSVLPLPAARQPRCASTAAVRELAAGGTTAMENRSLKSHQEMSFCLKKTLG